MTMPASVFGTGAPSRPALLASDACASFICPSLKYASPRARSSSAIGAPLSALASVEIQRASQVRNGLLVAAAFEQLPSGDRREMTLFVRTCARISPVQRQRDRVLVNRTAMNALDRTGNLFVQTSHGGGIDRGDESFANLVVRKPV